MQRLLLVALTGLLFVTPTRAAPPEGIWQLDIPIRGGSLTFLIMLSQDQDNWVGDFLDSSLELRLEPEIDDVTVNDRHVRFAVKFGEDSMYFDGRIGEEGQPILGTFSLGGPVDLVELRPSQLKNLDDEYAVNKERLQFLDEGQEYFDAAFTVLGGAGENMASVDEVRELADQLARRAEQYGPRWERDVALRMARGLAGNETLAPVAVEQARRAERMLDPRGPIEDQLEVLGTLMLVLRTSGNEEEAGQVEKRVARLEALDYAQYSKEYPPFEAKEFEGRRGDSKRAVLVELFTGTECPPCVAADLAFEALQGTFKPTEVVLLQYHLHIPGPDPMTNPSSEARSEYYADEVGGTPTVLFDGKEEGTGGGGLAQSEAKYDSYREDIIEVLEQPAGATIELTATREGETITAQANVSELSKTGEMVRLRFALVEELVRYPGGNGLRYHHHVVRAMPGGPEGFALTEDSSEQTVTIDLSEVRTAITAYLDEAEGIVGGFTGPRPALNLNKLHIIAFVQDDEGKQVLQSAQVTLE